MRAAIIGANGQLGTDLVRAFADGEVHGLTHEEIEVVDGPGVARVIGMIGPEVVVNTAAYHRLDDCEREPERAFVVNALGARNVARAAAGAGALCVHISTDYVFDGAKGSPYLEEDRPSPLNSYGITKLAGEYWVKSDAGEQLIVRTCGLYGRSLCRAKGGNFVESMLKKARAGEEIKVVDDETLTPTFTGELANKIRELVEGQCRGIFHLTNEGACSWYQFAMKIFEIAGLKPRVENVSSSQFRSAAKRPSYSVLENGALRRTGLAPMSPWEDALKGYLTERE